MPNQRAEHVPLWRPLNCKHQSQATSDCSKEGEKKAETASCRPSQRMWYKERCRVDLISGLLCSCSHKIGHNNRNTDFVLGLKSSAGSPQKEDIDDEDDKDNDVPAVESLRLHEEWLERERLAQEEFRLNSEREEAAKKRKEEEERMIKEEWAAQQRREQEKNEQKQQEKRDREEAVQKILDEAENQLENGGPWMNPEAPMTENSENFGTERDVANCPFFLKTGACRFGDRCSRRHVYPTTSPTLMIRGMFTTFGMEESCRDDYDMDACLEHSEEELQESFLEFYHDVLPEFKSVGKVVQFKVSCNYEPHLRGNVYIQFDTEDQCKEAFIKFNGRWYAGKQLHCEICPVTRWKNAICGLYDRQKCPKGKHCNFLHVFRNPGNEFWEADRDLHMSPVCSVRGSHRDGWHSDRHWERSWRQRHCSRSPLRSERFHNRREDDRPRSRSRERSRERRASHRDKEDKCSSTSRHKDRRKNRFLIRSTDRSRSRSRDREQDRLRNWSRDEGRENRNRDKDEGRENRNRDKDEDAPRQARERERNTSRERSPKKTDKSKKNANNDINTHRCHKHSKKSKKKNKKKHKKKSHLHAGTNSSGESQKEKESEEERDKHAAISPNGDRNETEQNQKNCDLDENVHTEIKSGVSNTERRSNPTENSDTNIL